MTIFEPFILGFALLAGAVVVAVLVALVVGARLLYRDDRDFMRRHDEEHWD